MQELRQDLIERFILAGKSRFTVKNESTGNRFTYRVAKKGSEEKPIYFVSVLTGCNNESDYTYLGQIYANGNYAHGRKSRISADSGSNKAFDWVWKHVTRLPEQVKVYHEGRCGACARTLTVPESVETGFGPDCASRLGI